MQVGIIQMCFGFIYWFSESYVLFVINSSIGILYIIVIIDCEGFFSDVINLVVFFSLFIYFIEV